MIKATTLVLESKDADATVQSKEIVSALTDAITIAMQCFHDMNSSRCQAMKKDLHCDYSVLCIIQQSLLLQSIYLETYPN